MFSASASRTTGPLHARRILSTRSRVTGELPSPGPIAMTSLKADEFRQLIRSRRPLLKERSGHSRMDRDFIYWARPQLEASPIPERSAPSPERIAAPAIPGPPPTMDKRPRVPLCASTGMRWHAFSRPSRHLPASAAPTSFRLDARPISTSTMSPQTAARDEMRLASSCRTKL